MQLNYEVQRNRTSVTQGEVTILLNGEELITFGDEMYFKRSDGSFKRAGYNYKTDVQHYGEVIDGWGSIISDENFIKSVPFPFFTNKEIIEKRTKEILNIK